MTSYLLFSRPKRRRFVRLEDLLGTVTAPDAEAAAAKLGLRITVTLGDEYKLEDSEGKRFIMTEPMELTSSESI